MMQLSVMSLGNYIVTSRRGDVMGPPSIGIVIEADAKVVCDVLQRDGFDAAVIHDGIDLITPAFKKF